MSTTMSKIYKCITLRPVSHCNHTNCEVATTYTNSILLPVVFVALQTLFAVDRYVFAGTETDCTFSSSVIKKEICFKECTNSLKC